MVKLNKKIIFIAIIVLVVIVTNILIIKNSDSSVVNNQKVIDQITRLSFLAADRNLTEPDLKKLSELTKKDNKVGGVLDQMYWLIRNNEAEHAAHSLASINVYVQTGRLEFCIPHEVQHLGLLVEHQDTGRAKNQLSLIKENIPKWLEKSEGAKINFPAYYINHEEVKSKINSVVENFESNNINEEFFEDIDYIGENGVC